MKLLAIDGNSILNRAYYGIRPLTTKRGVPTNAVFGFLNILLKLLRENQPDAVAVAFDVSRKTFRNDDYSEYKANRKGMPDDLREQLPIIQGLLQKMGYRIAVAEGFEGDDVLGTLAHSACENGHECVVATGDRDCLQLVNDCVKISLAKNTGNILYDTKQVVADFSITPAQVTDLKGLMGDSSDNIPGVKGIGEKTALALLEKHHTLDGLYENIDEVDATKRVKELLVNGREMAFLSKKLATIVTNAPVETDISAYVQSEYDEGELSAELTRLELFSFMGKLKIPKNGGGQVVEENVEQVKINVEEINGITDTCKEISLLLLDDGSILCNDNGGVFAVNVDACESFLKQLEEKKISIKTFKAKSLYKLCNAKLIDDIKITMDSEILAYLLNTDAKGYDIKGLTEEYLSEYVVEGNEDYFDIAMLPFLCDKLYDEVCKNGMDKLYNEIEFPLCRVLAEMENEGFEVDTEALKKFGYQLQGDIDLTREQIFRLAGEEFNINSTKELAGILFEKLGLPSGKKTKTGYSTGVEVLEELFEKHEIIPQILEYRKLTKLYSTYVEGLLKVIGEDGRVHSTFNQTLTRTGRISSTEPNVQNIPVRTKLGSEMRRFFVAREGYTLVDADYSQIELRILAHIADDEVMKNGFLNNADVHAITASQVFNHPLETLPSELRSRAKAINFGIVYGISAFSLSRDIHVTMHEAKEYMEAYLRTYSGIASYMKSVVEQARKDGFVTTLYGRKRDLKDINATNKNIKSFAERVALNTPVQGTAADIIKLSMIKVCDRIRKEKLDARLILQVHDELIVEAPVFQAEQVKKIVKEEMENSASLSIPLVVDAHIGKDWYIAKG